MSNKSKYIECILNTGQINNFIINNENYDNIDNLRKFHNYIKKQIIITNSREIKAEKLLDIASGRGGDIHKWRDSRLKYVFGFDSHKDSVNISIKRLKELIKNKIKLPFIKFYNLNILESNILNTINKIDKYTLYDIVSCQFAFHYFTTNDNTLNHVLNVISNKLIPGGRFIGTATDGDKIKNILNKGNVDIPLLTLHNVDNNSYIFNIKTKDNIRKTYFELQGESLEYFLFKDKLKTIGLKNNLKLLEFKPFYEWYNESFNLNTYEMIISFLNFSFIFEKN